ncbi:hypothetical protein EGR_08570 [Echinococcus granulosus]|uniref:Uncharacterized protein n=1 Tax=Echinococcus granulosus TaxID=6210 RepID=W6UT87_ECHGR|nr:hypothetical protein EGR_08570 [Echinococcus granulosus]EUB56604.1 hypothetical protein EGR_08570 [Echinococcus granulosus]
MNSGLMWHHPVGHLTTNNFLYNAAIQLVKTSKKRDIGDIKQQTGINSTGTINQHVDSLNKTVDNQRIQMYPLTFHELAEDDTTKHAIFKHCEMWNVIHSHESVNHFDRRQLWYILVKALDFLYNAAIQLVKTSKKRDIGDIKQQTGINSTGTINQHVDSLNKTVDNQRIQMYPLTFHELAEDDTTKHAIFKHCEMWNVIHSHESVNHFDRRQLWYILVKALGRRVGRGLV